MYRPSIKQCVTIIFMTQCGYITADEDDGYFGQEQVPLTDEIKEILEEYPDGQIFKVCKNTVNNLKFE